LCICAQFVHSDFKQDLFMFVYECGNGFLFQSLKSEVLSLGELFLLISILQLVPAGKEK